MSEPPPPSYGDQPPYGGGASPAAPAKPPPSWWWFVGPFLVLLVAGLVFVGMLIWTVTDLARVDARIPVDGRPHVVSVGTDRDRMLLVEASGRGQPCVVRDTDGRVIPLRPILGDVTVTRDGREWQGLTRFDPGDGRVVVRCSPAASMGSEVLVVPAIDVGGILVRFGAIVLLPMFLGGLGLLWALVLGILILTRSTSRT